MALDVPLIEYDGSTCIAILEHIGSGTFTVAVSQLLPAGIVTVTPVASASLYNINTTLSPI